MNCIFCQRQTYNLQNDSANSTSYQCPYENCAEVGLEFRMNNGKCSYIHMAHQHKDKIYWIHIYPQGGYTYLGVYTSNGRERLVTLNSVPDLNPQNFKDKLPFYLTFL